MFSSIITFDFDLILGSLFTFWGPTGLYLGSGQGSKPIFGSNHAEQFLFSLVPPILTFDFDTILGSFLALMGYFWDWGRVQKLFWDPLI